MTWKTYTITPEEIGKWKETLTSWDVNSNLNYSNTHWIDPEIEALKKRILELEEELDKKTDLFCQIVKELKDEPKEDD